MKMTKQQRAFQRKQRLLWAWELTLIGAVIIMWLNI